MCLVSLVRDFNSFPFKLVDDLRDHKVTVDILVVVQLHDCIADASDDVVRCVVCAVVDAFIGSNAQVDDFLFCFVWFHVCGWLIVML